MTQDTRYRLPPLPIPRVRKKLIAQIEMVQSRIRALQDPDVPEPTKHDLRLEVEALTYSLEQIGYPPSSYQDALVYLRDGKLPSSDPGSDTNSTSPDLKPYRGNLDDRATLMPGDVAESLHSRHRGRTYAITRIDGDGDSRVIWGHRTSEALSTEHQIDWPLQKVGEVCTWVSRHRATRPPKRQLPAQEFVIGDVVEDARRCPKRATPGRWVVTRALSGPYGRLHYGYRIREVGNTRRAAGIEVQITWPVRRVGGWVGDLHGSVPDGLVKIGTGTGTEDLGIGDLVESVPKREPPPSAPKPALFIITRLHGTGLSGPVRYGRKVLRLTGKVVGAEVPIYWQIRKVDPGELSGVTVNLEGTR